MLLGLNGPPLDPAITTLELNLTGSIVARTLRFKSFDILNAFSTISRQTSHILNPYGLFNLPRN